MKITWVCCRSYEDAQDYSRIIYLHEWGGEPFYWGKIENSFFGGNPRPRDGQRLSGRYAPSYRHWIEGCLRHGARLYIGKLDDEALQRMDELEKSLIHRYGSEMNKRIEPFAKHIDVQHAGDIPSCILQRLAASSVSR